VLIIEELEHARARGAHIYAEICGFGQYSEAFSFLIPEPDGKAMTLSITKAMKEAGVTETDIDHINPHGAGTKAGDEAEYTAIR
jgi:3-oxoacyl-[acyl-carrier-protein] synthase II